MLTSQGRLDLWHHFRSGYKLVAGRRLVQTADVEYVFMCRGLLAAANHQPGVAPFLVQLSQGFRAW